MATEKAIFAGGCFWCMVEPFEEQAGILTVTSGYTGGHVENPTYDQVSGHYTGHAEAVEIFYDDEQLSYEELLDIYWSIIDPTDGEGQFLDRGDNYRPVIFVTNKNQEQLATASKEKLAVSGLYDKPIAVTIEPAAPFYPAEDYHQDWYKRNPERYQAMEKARQRLMGMKKFKRRFFGRKK